MIRNETFLINTYRFRWLWRK